MENIMIGSFKLHLNFETQISPTGRPLRLSGVSLKTKLPAEWIKDQGYRHGTIYTFRYLDNDSEFVSFEFNAKGKFVCKVN